jgi:hypothetical protein
MGNGIMIADLTRDGGQSPSIRFEEVKVCHSFHDPQHNFTIDFIKPFHYDNKNAEKLLSSEKQIKAISKGFNTSAVLSQLLNSKLQKPTHEKDADNCLGGQRPFVTAGESVIIVEEAFAASQIDHHSWNLFVSTEFYFPAESTNTGHDLVSTQHLQVSCPTLKLHDPLFSDCDISAFNHIEIVSGVCIFNGDLLNRSISILGSVVVDPALLEQSKPTFHEMEYLARSSSAIADVVAMLVARIQEKGSKLCVGITLDVPSFHYYHSVVTKVEQGLCTTEVASRWMDAVDRRHDQVSKVFTQSVQYELLRRGVDALKYDIYTSSRMNSTATSIRQSLDSRRFTQVESILETLDQTDEAWSEFYKLIAIKERPRDLEDLSYLFYVFEVLKPALAKPSTRYHPVLTPEKSSDKVSGFKIQMNPRSTKKTELTSSCLIITVDDPAERRIYSRSQEALRKLRGSKLRKTNSSLIEVYMCRRVFVNSNRTRSRLYHQDPMPELPIWCSSSDYECDATRLIDPLGLVSQLYGSEYATCLQWWFSGVGLKV